MPVPPTSEILSIDPEVLAILGKTAEEIATMGLHEFAELSYSKGIQWTVGQGGRVKGLTIRFDREQQQAQL